MPVLHLTDIVVQRLAPGTYFDESTPAFAVRVGKNRKTFFVIRGEDRKRTNIGRYPAVTLAKVPNRIVDWLVDRKFIKEGTEWPVAPHAVDPTVAEKVRRIEAYGAWFELEFLPQVMYWSSRLFGKSR